MDEKEYRHTYNSLNTQRCVFEKTILTQTCRCRFQQNFNLAEREGIRCTEQKSQNNCLIFLNECRQHARFALHLSSIVGNLIPHSKEIKVQKGALLGLMPEQPNLPETQITDIYQLIDQAILQSQGDLKTYPYQQLMSSISHHPSRKKRRNQRK